MQDTPEFSRLQQLFASSFTEDNILAPQSNQPINKPEADTISRAFEYAQIYFTDTGYRQTLSATTRQNIESQINAITDQFNQINSLRSQNNLAPNLQNIVNSINSNLDELRMRFITPRNVYVLQGNKETVNSTLTELNKAQEKANDIVEKLKENLDFTNEEIGNTTDQDLASYFYELYNGNRKESKSSTSQKRSANKKRNLTQSRIIGLGVVLIIVTNLIQRLVNKSQNPKPIFLGISIALLMAVCSWGIVLYIRWFVKKYPGGYERAAKLWFHAVMAAIIITAVYSLWVVHAYKIDPNKLTLNEAIVKAIVLLAPIYLIRFSVRNFNANKHLATINLHRATSIRTFRGFIKPLDTVGPSNQKEVYGEIIKLVFAPEESGFITRRDGAGSSDSGVNLPIGS